MHVLGLTAGIGSGKSVIAQWFREKGVPVLEADAMVHTMYQSDSEMIRRLRNAFGKDILTAQSTVDREKLGEVAFGSEEDRDTLNKIVHPEVRRELERQIRAHRRREIPLLVLEIPLLLESRMEDLVNKIIVVVSTKEQQRKRVMERDKISLAEAEKRIDAQMPEKEKIKKADYVIDNTKSMFNAKQQFEELYRTLQEETG